MKIDYNIPDNRVEITEFELVISDEAIPAADLHWMQYQLWLLAQTTPNECLSNVASRFECIVAALTNDTDAIILHRKE